MAVGGGRASASGVGVGVGVPTGVPPVGGGVGLAWAAVGGGVVPSAGWHCFHSALALPKFASGWIWSPWPAYHWNTTGSSPNTTRAPPRPEPPVHGLRSGCGGRGNERVRQNSALRWSCRNAAGMREEVRRPRRASDSTPAITARSSLRRQPWMRPATLRAWR